jgi:hypothetical protein
MAMAAAKPARLLLLPRDTTIPIPEGCCCFPPTTVDFTAAGRDRYIAEFAHNYLDLAVVHFYYSYSSHRRPTAANTIEL